MANPWTRLKQLLPDDANLVGTVTLDLGNGTSRVSLVGGGTMVAVGSGYEVNQKVFITGSTITGTAPDLQEVSIEV